MKTNKELVCKNLKPLIEKILNLSSKIISIYSLNNNKKINNTNQIIKEPVPIYYKKPPPIINLPKNQYISLRKISINSLNKVNKI